MFVPSLSWQNDRFYIQMAQKCRFSRCRMGGYALKSGATVAELMSQGESTCNAAMAAAILPRLADVLELAQSAGVSVPGGAENRYFLSHFS